MTDTNPISVEVADAAVAPRFSGLPFLLFSLALLTLLAISQLIVLPRLTSLPIGGTMLDVSALRAEEDRLAGQVTAAEDTRRQLILPTSDPVYDALKLRKQALPSALDLQTMLEVWSQAVSPEDSQGPAVILTRFDYDPGRAALQLTGDVRGVGPRSMTVLAGFIDVLKASNIFAQVDTPVFAREENADGSFHSPFTIRLQLRSSPPDA